MQCDEMDVSRCSSISPTRVLLSSIPKAADHRPRRTRPTAQHLSRSSRTSTNLIGHRHRRLPGLAPGDSFVAHILPGALQPSPAQHTTHAFASCYHVPWCVHPRRTLIPTCYSHHYPQSVTLHTNLGELKVRTTGVRLLSEHYANVH